MNLSKLKPAKGATHSSKKIGRGQGSGRGGTSTRGHNGAQSRSGYKQKFGFEGGQMPIQRRLPKFGFKSIGRVEYKAINLSVIEMLVGKLELDKIDVDTLVQAGMASKNEKVKILANGELTKPIEITAHAFSNAAKEAIEAKGGKAIKL